MELTDKIVVVTGAAGGIGRGLAERFAKEDAKTVICADIDLAGAQRVAESIGGVALHCNVGREADIRSLVETVEDRIGPIDLFCSNAGILTLGGVDVPDQQWQRTQRDGGLDGGQGCCT